MHLFSEKFNNLQELFVAQLKDIYDAENRIIDALPDMVEAAHNPDLKSAFSQHLQESRQQCAKLEDLFRSMNMEPERKTCDGIKGVLSEGSEMADAEGDANTCDAALIAGAQKVEHYEIASYGTLRTWALELGMQDFANTLQSILDEEKATDEKLTHLAEARINVSAAH